jgi:hypothetical protein
MSPTVLRTGGFRLFFFSREETRIHVHLMHAEGEAKFWLEPDVALAKTTGLSHQQVSAARAIVEEHCDDIRRRWSEHFGRG